MRGQRLRIADGVRPTSQRVREALFSRWQGRVAGATFLDLFAGSGAVGLEAASRGAERVVCVEAESRVQRELAAACSRLAPEVVTVRSAQLPEDLGRVVAGARFALVFADPPYAFERWEALLEGIGEVLEADGEAVLEHAWRTELPSRAGRLELLTQRRYGDSGLSFFVLSDDTDAVPRK